MVAFATTATARTDALRRRVQKVYAGTTTTFAYDGWRCVAEYENGASASSPARDFVFGAYLDEPLMMVTAPAGAATKRYYHSDHLYSIYALTDAAGAVIERYRYEAYGQATVLTAGFVAKSDPNYSEFGSPWTYTGQRLDAETGLHYYKNRFYSAGLGRFVGRDPIGYIGGINLNAYVGNRPNAFVDPWGAKSKAAKGGTLEWEVTAINRDQVSFKAKFIPDDGCCCQNISFVQVVVENTVGGSEIYPGRTKEDQDYYKKFSGDGKGGYRVDHVKGETDPYFGAEWDPQSKSWKNESGDRTVGSCNPKRNASISDVPTSTFARTGKGVRIKKFETCAFCIDTQEVLGCIKWGFELADAADSVVSVTGGEDSDFGDSASDGFKNAAGKWNEAGADNADWSAIGQPTKTAAGTSMGGSPALPAPPTPTPGKP